MPLEKCHQPLPGFCPPMAAGQRIAKRRRKERAGVKQWLTKFSEFTGTNWSAFQNDVSHFLYTPLFKTVNR